VGRKCTVGTRVGSRVGEGGECLSVGERHDGRGRVVERDQLPLPLLPIDARHVDNHVEDVKGELERLHVHGLRVCRDVHLQNCREVRMVLRFVILFNPVESRRQARGGEDLRPSGAHEAAGWSWRQPHLGHDVEEEGFVHPALRARESGRQRPSRATGPGEGRVLNTVAIVLGVVYPLTATLVYPLTAKGWGRHLRDEEIEQRLECCE